MALYTKAYLREVASSESLNESTRRFSQRDIHQLNFDIFLCHSFLDQVEVRGMYLELTRMGFSVYVDWITDPQLDRSNVTKESAELIRGRLRSSKSLLLAFSANAGLSKWMPWELGYVDGHVQKCGIVPISEIQQASYHRSEYLLLYPELIKPGAIFQKSNPVYIMEQSDIYVGFSEWLRGDRPSYRSSKLF